MQVVTRLAAMVITLYILRAAIQEEIGHPTGKKRCQNIRRPPTPPPSQKAPLGIAMGWLNGRLGCVYNEPQGKRRQICAHTNTNCLSACIEQTQKSFCHQLPGHYLPSHACQQFILSDTCSHKLCWHSVFVRNSCVCLLRVCLSLDVNACCSSSVLVV